MEGYRFIKQPFHSFGLLAAQVAFTDLDAPDFAAAGYMKTGFGPFVGLDLRHL